MNFDMSEKNLFKHVEDEGGGEEQKKCPEDSVNIRRVETSELKIDHTNSDMDEKYTNREDAFQFSDELNRFDDDKLEELTDELDHNRLRQALNMEASAANSISSETLTWFEGASPTSKDKVCNFPFFNAFAWFV